ncbi:hypothetical protein MPSEU_000307700 [Mayamaea pseudoterrestris]|nr:hypothetical protein MPSEU_000307700 [Mayamaea pseudoterrestris]
MTTSTMTVHMSTQHECNKSNGNGHRRRNSPREVILPSSLDFERVVNLYSIQATIDQPMHSRKDTSSLPEEVHLLGSSLQEFYDSNASSSLKDTFAPPPPPPPPMPQVRELSLLSQNPRPLGYTGSAATRWILIILTGLMTGLSSILIVKCTSVIEAWRSSTMDRLWRENAYSATIFLTFASLNLILAMLSAILCVYVAPEAIGSGIPEVKAYLNGVRVKRFARARLFFSTIVATILSVSSGLVIGPEGPLISVGSCLGAGCTKLYSVLLRLPRAYLPESVLSFIVTDLSHFSNDGERRDLVSVGAAAGFASAFGAPIGGLLFSMEEASSYFDHSMFLKTLAATAVATFCIAVHHGSLSDYSIISLGSFHSNNSNIFLNRVEELPLYVLIAVVGGVMGGVFVRCWTFLQNLRRNTFTQRQARNAFQLGQVAFVSLLTSALTYFIPLICSCRKIDDDDDYVTKLGYDSWKDHAHQFDCNTGEINELAAIFFGSRDEAISAILTDPRQFEVKSLVITGILFFFLMTLTLGVALPSGVFMPTFLIGSSLGGAAGSVFVNWLGQEVSRSTFALLGAAALLAGIQRSPVSLCVIIIEGTGQVKTLIPVIITVVIARYVGDLVSRLGLYEAAMEINQYPYLHHDDLRNYDIIEVSRIMSSPVVTVGPRERAGDLARILRDTDHHGFPVVDPETKAFLGLVRRNQIIALIECGQFDDENDDDNDMECSYNTSTCDSKDKRNWTPKAGLSKTPLMHLAFDIKSDRYEHISDPSIPQETTESMLAEDDHDSHDWLATLSRNRDRLQRLGLPFESVLNCSLLPLENPLRSAGAQRGAVVGVKMKGTVYIKWLLPANRVRYVNIAAVMNRGTYCVTEFCPVSKAISLFTKLGLRHLVVLGGVGGGQVVGMVTRVNLLRQNIKELIAERAGYYTQRKYG